MAMRSVVSRGVLRHLMEVNLQSSAYGVRYLSDGGHILSEEERAKETVYIQKMEHERQEKLKKKQEKEKVEKEKDDKKAEEETH